MKKTVLTRVAAAFTAALLAALPAALGTPALASSSQAAQSTRSEQSTQASSPTQSGTDSATNRSSTVVLTQVTPWLDDKGTLTVKGTVRTTRAVTGPRLALQLSADSFDSRDRVESWAERPSDLRTLATGTPTTTAAKGDSPIVAPKLPGALNANSTTDFTFTVPAKRLGLSTANPLRTWGAHGLRVRLSSQADASVDLGSATAFTTWYPEPAVQPTKLAAVLPVTLTGFGREGLINPADLEEASGKSGALRALVTAVKRNDKASLAVDPRLVRSVQTALEEPTTDPDQAIPTAQATVHEGASPTAVPSSVPQLTAVWNEFTAATRDRSIIALPWADADLVALSAAKLDDQQTVARDSTQIVKQAFPQARVDVSWPASGTANPNALRTAAHNGSTAVVLSDTQQPGNKPYTLGSRSSVSVGAGSGEGQGSGDSTALTSLISDSRLSLLAGQISAGSSQSSTPSQAVLVSEFVAQTAALTAERPSDSRSVMFALPRTNATDGWSAVTSLTGSLPWIQAQNLSDLVKTEPVSRGALVQPSSQDNSSTTSPFAGPSESSSGDFATPTPQATGSAGTGSRSAESNSSLVPGLTETAAQRYAARTRTMGVSADQIEPLRTSASRMQAYAALFSDPDSARTAESRMLLTCASVGWAARSDLSKCVSQARDEAVAQSSAITIDQGSQVLLVTGEKTTIPISLENTSARAANLRVRLVPDTPQLRAQQSDEIELQPGERKRVDVPVEGITNADVTTRVRLVAADGYSPEGNSQLLVRVRADWENIGVAAVGGGVGLVFIIGLIGTIRRGRRKLPANQLDAARGATSTAD